MSVGIEQIQLAAAGDRDSQRFIYETLGMRVYRLVLRIVGSSDADDVTQDVFIRIFSKLSTFRHESEFTTWVHRLAVNEAIQHLRRVRRRAAVPLQEKMLESRSNCDVETKEIFEVALSRIDRELRIMLELKEVERLSYSQIAEIVGVAEGTVGSRLNRARHELRIQLTALGWEDFK